MQVIHFHIYCPNRWSAFCQSLAQTSPAVPPKVWQAIENEISGDNSYDMIRHLTRYHAPNGSNDDFEDQAK